VGIIPQRSYNIGEICIILAYNYSGAYREIMRTIDFPPHNIEVISAIFKTPMKKRDDDGTLRRLTPGEEIDDDIEASRRRSEEAMFERAEESRKKRQKALRRARDITDDQIIAKMSGEEPFSEVELRLLLSLLGVANQHLNTRQQLVDLLEQALNSIRAWNNEGLHNRMAVINYVWLYVSMINFF